MDRKKNERRALSEVAKASRPSYDISAFLLYVNQSERGRRREATQALDAFIKQAERWNTDRRRDFAAWLLTIVEGLSDAHEVLQPTLRSRFLQPVLMGWLTAAPQEVRPYRWLGMFFETPEQGEHLRTTIRLGGQGEQRAIIKLLHKTLYGFWYNQHHMPQEYMGDAEQDRILAEEMGAYAGMVRDRRVREGLQRDLNACRKNAEDWAAFSQSGEQDFMAWRQLRVSEMEQEEEEENAGAEQATADER